MTTKERVPRPSPSSARPAGPNPRATRRPRAEPQAPAFAAGGRATASRRLQRAVGNARTALALKPPAGDRPPTGPGSPLPDETRAELERTFGAPLDDVRVHTDASAGRAAEAIGANAFTAGRDVYFASGRYAPQTLAGRRLLAHEIVHTVQAEAVGAVGGAVAPAARTVSAPQDPDEEQADALAAGAARGEVVGPIRPPTLAPARFMRNGNEPRTLDDLIVDNPPGFTDARLDAAYQEYVRTHRDHLDPKMWALHQTTGRPRERLLALLGPDFARGQRAALERPPVNVLQAGPPAGYTDERVAADARALTAHPTEIFSRLDRLVETPIEGGLVSSGQFGILKGNIAEILARPMLEEELATVRRDHPDAQLFLGVRARLRNSDGTFTEPVLFGDGLIASIRADGLHVHRLVEIKSGVGGGGRAQEQIHRWIEAHSTVGLVIELPGVTRSFQYSDALREVFSLTTARRLAIVPRGERLPDPRRTGHGTTAPVTGRQLAQNPEEVEYLTRLVAQALIQYQQAMRLRREADQGRLSPARVGTLAELQSHALARRIQDLNGSLALVEGRLYRVRTAPTAIEVRELPVARIAVPFLPAWPGTGAPPPTRPPIEISFGPPSAGIVPPNILNFTDRDIVVGGRRVSPSGTSAPNVGELIVVGAEGFWIVSDVRTRQPVAGVFEGGRWYVVAPGGRAIPLDTEGRIRSEVEPIPFEHLPQAVQRASPGAAGQAAGGPSASTRAVAGGLGLIMVVNEILGPIGRVLDIQRHNIAMGRAAVDFWMRFGANPTFGVWHQNDRRPLPADMEPSTSVFGSPSFPYVVDIDVAAFGRALPERIRTYQELELFLDLARTLETIGQEPRMPAFPTREQRAQRRRYYTVVSPGDPGRRRVYDLTDIIEGVRERTLGALDAEMRAQLRGLPPSERDNIFRLRSGSETRLFRSARGGQPILSSRQLLGPDPWVRPLGRRIGGGAWSWFMHGHSEQRVLVAPANADAQRSALVSAYLVKRDIDDTLSEVRGAGRPILHRVPESGRLESFVAGPEPGASSRFGETRYYRHQQEPGFWTVAIGELREFWVDAGELDPVTRADVESALTARPSGPPR